MILRNSAKKMESQKLVERNQSARSETGTMLSTQVFSSLEDLFQLGETDAIEERKW